MESQQVTTADQPGETDKAKEDESNETDDEKSMD